MRQGIGRHQRRAFWEATVAVCALLAASDGKVSFATRVRIDNILDSLPDLKIFGTGEFVDLFDRFVEEFQTDPRRARKRALEVARKGTHDKDEAELLVRIAGAVADAGRSASRVQTELIEALSRELGVAASHARAGAGSDAAVERREDIETAAVVAHPRQANGAEQGAGESAAAPAEKASEESTAPEAEAPMSTETQETPHAATAPAATTTSGDGQATTERTQQMRVEGTQEIFALCGRTKSGSLEALRVYENERLAEADCALAERITNDRFWLCPVALFPSSGESDDDGQSGVHVLCLGRADGSVEALRAFKAGDQANADLEFFRNISNEKMWVSSVQFKTGAL